MPAILQNHHVLAVPSIVESARFFVEVLGFKIVNQPPGWIFVQKDHCMIMLGECPDDIHPGKLGCHNYFAYLRVDDAAAYHAELTGKAAPGVGPISDKPWQMGEFAVTSPEGYRITIGQSL